MSEFTDLPDQYDMLEKENLTLIPVNNLLNANFFIPGYQRGYRWTNIQVTQLLNDIWEYKTSKPKSGKPEESPFYCLQPVAVKKKQYKGRGYWEVIDGQQRLTTILIILYYFNEKEFKEPNPLFNLVYQTRTDSSEFLENIKDPELAKLNIDYNHIHLAYQTISNWFEIKKRSDAAARMSFYPVLINEVKVIWYKIDDNPIEAGSSASIDVFTRLNIGKIMLTNAELIKALFLQKENFDEDKVSLKQLQIAGEWDIIEKQLQNDAFWYFIYDKNNPLKYENRIEYIFDLMKNKNEEHEHYYTFDKFTADFKNVRGRDGKPDIDKLWIAVKKHFLSFEEWYGDKEFYHLIGFLVDCGVSISELKVKAEKTTKSEFKKYLRDLIKLQVALDMDYLGYDNREATKKVLLLFNIQTILATANADFRFPFYRYKEEDWDIEHVRSKTDKTVTVSQRADWLIDILEYLTGEDGYSADIITGTDMSERERQVAAVELLQHEEEKGYAKTILKLLEAKKIDDGPFESLYRKISEIFGENVDPGNIDHISNLALLDSATNRSYKNAMFPIKRKRILENDMNGIFVPICTRNLFLKSYSSKMSDLLYWKADDASSYLKGIKRVLKNYLPAQ